MTAPVPLRELLGPRCLDQPAQRQRYEQPERGAPGHASCVLLPHSEAQVGTILQICNVHDLKLVISAGRTGLVEAQRPQGEAVLSLEKLNRILEIDAAARSATCEAGVTVDALNAALEPQGLVWPLEMGSSSAATVGACVANASAGANAVCYGTAAHLCEQAWGWWGSGNVGTGQGPAWRAPAADECAIDSARLRPQWGLIGTQGVLGVITRVRLRLLPIPAQREAALIPLADMPQAMDVLAAARVEFPGDVEEFEFISRSAYELVRDAKGAAFRSPLAALDQPYVVLLQIKSDDATDDLAARLYHFLGVELALPDERIGYAPLKVLKSIRHSITEASNVRMRTLGGGRLTFDTATPLPRFGAYLSALEAELRRLHPHMELLAFGHAGVGGAHLHLLATPEDPIAAQAVALIKLVFDITQDFGGTFSAEHGVGPRWGAEFRRRVAPQMLSEMIAAKRERDPFNILNPRSFGFDQLLLS
jgi:FAD/FMN-containing dehydrogenase